MPRKPRLSVELSLDEYWIETGIDIRNRRLMLDEDVDSTTMGLLIRGLLAMETSNPNLPITLYVSTYGGSVYDGIALYDALRASSCEIITVGIGKIMSMGTWLMLAGDVKRAYPNATFMWHSISDEAGGKLFELETSVKDTKRIYDRLLEIYSERSKKTKAYWQQWLKYEDRYGDVSKALELGFIDEVVS